MAILVTGWLYYHYHRNISLPVVPYEFSIEPGSNLKQISKQLADEGILPNSWSFILLSRLLRQESSVKAGDYRLSGTIGQADAGTLITESYRLLGGFWSGVFEYTLFLPLILR